jgi:hypothetical protein
MKVGSSLIALLSMCLIAMGHFAQASGITPEQIYQASVDWNAVIGTWEILPEDSPLFEKEKQLPKATQRTLMTLRKDGTCRVFNKEYPLGADGIWTPKEHEMSLTFGTGGRLDLYVYGVKGDFMITQSQGGSEKEQLWSRVK